MSPIYSLKSRAIAAFAACAAFACILATPRMAHAQSEQAQSAAEIQAAPAAGEHELSLYNTHTNERLTIVYRHGSDYVPGALAKLDYFLRDHNTNEVRHFDPHLYDILSDLTAKVGHANGEIDIVCGYRTPSTNAALRERTNGVAKNSLHIQAEAIDFRMPGVNTLGAASCSSRARARRRRLLPTLRLHPRRCGPCAPVVFRLPRELNDRRLASPRF